MRIVSLVPSVTETLIAWRVPPVACTRFCEQPGLPTVGGTKNPDLTAIFELAPDLVVVDEEENRREDHDELVAGGVAVHALAIRSLDDVVAQLPELGDLVGARVDPLVPSGPPARAPYLRAFVPIWRRPWMALGADTYGGSLLAHLGVEVVPRGGRYDEVDLDSAAREGPDLVLVPDEPYAFRDDHLVELEVVAPPVRVDGQDLFWWGARTAAAIDRLREQLARR